MASTRQAKLETVGLDTNFWIYHLENHQKYGQITEKFLHYCLSNHVNIIISSLTITESYVLPLKHKDINLVHTYHQLFSLPIIKIVNLDQSIAFMASSLRAQYNVSTPDSIHLATAINQNCQFFISNDKKLSKVKQIKVLDMAGLKNLYLTTS